MRMWVGRVRVEGVSVVWIRLMRKRRVKVGGVKVERKRVGSSEKGENENWYTVWVSKDKIRRNRVEWVGRKREKGKENVSGESVREERKNLEEENEERR